MDENVDMVTVAEWAGLRGCSKVWALKLAVAGRIEGAVKAGPCWVVPRDAGMPDKLRPGPKPDMGSARVRQAIERASVKDARHVAKRVDRIVQAGMTAEERRAAVVAQLSPAQLHTLKRRDAGCKRTGEAWEFEGSWVGPVWLEGMSKADFDARVDEFLTWEESDYALAAPAWIPPI